MLSIVGNRIYIHEGDDCSFKTVYKGKNGNLLNFHATDILTLIIKDRESKKVIMSKVADSIKVNGEENESTIFSFFSKDASLLPHNDYLYDLVLETEAGSRHTLIDNAFLNVLESNYPKGDIFETSRLVPLNYNIMYLCETPLVCDFNYIQIDRKDVEGTLILYDRPYNKVIDNEDDLDEEGTLILF